MLWKPADMSLGELGRRTGLTDSHLSRIFGGKQRPSLRAAAVIARALHLTLDELLAKLPYPDLRVIRRY